MWTWKLSLKRPDVKHIYEVPLALKKEGLDELILKKLNIKLPDRGIKNWEEGVFKRLRSPAKEVKIAVVGKYISLQDAYKSIYEALVHGGIANNAQGQYFEDRFGRSGRGGF